MSSIIKIYIDAVDEIRQLNHGLTVTDARIVAAILTIAVVISEKK